MSAPVPLATRAKDLFLFLLHTPLLPPPSGPPVLELQTMTPSRSTAPSAVNSPTSRPGALSTDTDSESEAGEGSGHTSIELAPRYARPQVDSSRIW